MPRARALQLSPALAGVVSLQLLAASPMMAQVPQPSTIRDQESCPTCTIHLQRVAQLGNSLGASESGSQGDLRAITRDSRGQYYATYGGGQASEIFVHAPDGRVLRTIGRKGEGPGEFQSVGLLAIAPGDTLHAFDAIARRWSVIAPDGRFVRSAALPTAPRSAVPLRDGAMLVNGTVRTAEHIGVPLHVLDATGEIRRSFGRDEAVRRPDLSLLGLREITRAGGDNVWVLHVNEYRIEEWDLAGRRLSAFVRSPSWFRPWLTPASMSPTVPPSSHPVGFAAADDDHAWTVTRVAAPDWHRSLREARSESGRVVYVADDLPAVYDSMIEYIDLRRGRVVARARSPMALGAFVDRDHLVGFTFDGDGRLQISIWRVQLVSP